MPFDSVQHNGGSAVVNLILTKQLLAPGLWCKEQYDKDNVVNGKKVHASCTADAVCRIVFGHGFQAEVDRRMAEGCLTQYSSQQAIEWHLTRAPEIKALSATIPRGKSLGIGCAKPGNLQRVISYNDLAGVKHAHIMAWFDRAIEHARKKETADAVR